MKNKRGIVNIAIAGLLAIGVIGIGATSYYQIQADTVLPGYATAEVKLTITVPENKTVTTEATFTPSEGKKYYFKSRSFDLTAGTNTINWFIRKIPGGNYAYRITSDQGIFTVPTSEVSLTSDRENPLDPATLDLGSPAPVEIQADSPAPLSNVVTDSPTDTTSITPADTTTDPTTDSTGTDGTSTDGTGGSAGDLSGLPAAD